MANPTPPNYNDKDQLFYFTSLMGDLLGKAMLSRRISRKELAELSGFSEQEIAKALRGSDNMRLYIVCLNRMDYSLVPQLEKRK
jgi:hypothetical protein